MLAIKPCVCLVDAQVGVMQEQNTLSIRSRRALSLPRFTEFDERDSEQDFSVMTFRFIFSEE